MTQFKTKVAFITGGGTGIGAAVAQQVDPLQSVSYYRGSRASCHLCGFFLSITLSIKVRPTRFFSTRNPGVPP